MNTTRSLLSLLRPAGLLGALALSACGQVPGGTPDAGSLVDQGKAAVTTRGCGTCHQSKNAADGTLSGQTDPQPGTTAYGANLTPDVDTGLGSWTEEQIIKAIRTGVDKDGKELCIIMTRFPSMSDDEAKAIVAYLKSLPPVNRQIPASDCQ